MSKARGLPILRRFWNFLVEASSWSRGRNGGWRWVLPPLQILRSIEQEAREQGALSRGEGSDGDSTPPERKPLNRSGGLRPMFRSANRRSQGSFPPAKSPLPPASSLRGLLAVDILVSLLPCVVNTHTNEGVLNLEDPNFFSTVSR